MQPGADNKEKQKPSVLLLRPPLLNTFCANTPPLGLGYLLTNLKRAGFSAELIDLSSRNDAPVRLCLTLTEDHPPTVVGIQVFSNELTAARQTAKLVRRQLGDRVTIVAGGPHVTTQPEQLFSHLPEIDYGIRGEGETALALLVKHLEGDNPITKEAIPGLIWREGEHTAMNAQAYEEDLDCIGPPDWDGLDLAQYNSDAFGGGFNLRSPSACIQTSRGCPFHCTFCAVIPIAGHKFRRHSAAEVASQVKELMRRGYREIKIVDDNFAADPRHVQEIRDEFVREKIDVAVSFACGFHLRTINEELIDRIKAIGVYEVMVAIESGSDRILADMKKNITVDLAKEKIALLRRHNLPVTGYFMMGYPTEKREDIEKTISLSLSLPLERAHFNCFSPYPGSEVYAQLESEHRLQEIRPEAVHAETINYSYVPGMSVRELANLRRRALLLFYLRPRIVWAFLRGMRNWPIIKFRLEKAFEYFGWTKPRARKALSGLLAEGRGQTLAGQNDDRAGLALPCDGIRMRGQRR